jgi:hypothetical protein
MNFPKILALQLGILACSNSLAPCKAEPSFMVYSKTTSGIGAEQPSRLSPKSTASRASFTKLKLSLNEGGDIKSERPDGPPRLSEAELLRLAELKGKFEDSTAPKRSELQSLHRQMTLAMAKPAVDRAQVMQLQSKINVINSDLANARLNFMLDLNEGMPTEAKEKMRKHLLFDAAFGPPDMGFGGPPPPGPGLPPTCVPPGFGPPPPHLGPPPSMGFPPGLRPEGMLGPKPGRGPRGVSESLS